MTSFKHQYFASPQRVSRSVCSDRCENILYKAVFEHCKEIQNIAALLLTSKSFQNSTFGANFIMNFVVGYHSIALVDSVLSPSSCFSVQFVPSLHIDQYAYNSREINRSFINFVDDLVNTKYLSSSLRSLTLENVTKEVLSFFFESCNSNAWPQLRDLTLENCRLNDKTVEMISKSALQLRAVNFLMNSGITDAGIEHISKLSGITCLNLSGCFAISDAGLEHLGKRTNITSLNLYGCHLTSDAGLEHLSRLSEITSVNLTKCGKISDVGLEHLSKLNKITSLDLSHCYKISDVGLEHIAKLTNITSLNLSFCGDITDAGLEHISTLSKMDSLNLSFCRLISNVGLKHCAKFPSITSLVLSFCGKITTEAKKEFQIALPQCKLRD